MSNFNPSSFVIQKLQENSQISEVSIKVFYLPADARENCFKKNIKIDIQILKQFSRASVGK